MKQNKRWLEVRETRPGEWEIMERRPDGWRRLPRLGGRFSSPIEARRDLGTVRAIFQTLSIPTLAGVDVWLEWPPAHGSLGLGECVCGSPAAFRARGHADAYCGECYGRPERCAICGGPLGGDDRCLGCGVEWIHRAP